MITAILLFSVVAIMLTVLSFCLIWAPSFWLRIWSPWWQFIGAHKTSWGKKRLLLGIRVRSAMACVITFALAMFLPMITTGYVTATDSARGETPTPTPKIVPTFEFQKIPQRSAIPTLPPLKLAVRLRRMNEKDR